MTALPVRFARLPLPAVAVLVVLLHQIFSLALLVFEMPRGKRGLPPDLGCYLLYVLEWPFALLPAATAQNPTPIPVSLEWPTIIGSWLFGSVFWSTVICIIVAWRRRQVRPVYDATT